MFITFFEWNLIWPIMAKSVPANQLVKIAVHVIVGSLTQWSPIMRLLEPVLLLSPVMLLVRIVGLPLTVLS